jgi:hypothetical protein
MGDPGTEPYRQTRIRLNEETAALLYEMLREYLSIEWDVRATLKRNGGPPVNFNRRIRMTKKLMDEVQRAREEAGWLTRPLRR